MSMLPFPTVSFAFPSDETGNGPVGGGQTLFPRNIGSPIGPDERESTARQSPEPTAPAPDLCHSSRKSCRVKKGEGPESRRFSPDAHDGYQFESKSSAYFRIRQLGFERIHLPILVRLSNVIEADLAARGIRPTPRNRNARRRKPKAFHWLDENWQMIAPIFNFHALRGLKLTAGFANLGSIPPGEERVAFLQTPAQSPQ
jgi:hypothetical protein